jgi:hypothetical protein
LDARKQQMGTAFASATVISWALTNTFRVLTHESIGEEIKGFVHASTLIRLGSLRRVFPENLSKDTGEIVEVAFKEVLHFSTKVHFSTNPLMFLAVPEYERLPFFRLLGTFCTVESQQRLQDAHASTIR